MLKREINGIRRIKKEMGTFGNFFDVDYILFLFGFKPAIIIFSELKNNKKFCLLVDLYISFSEKCTGKIVYAYDLCDEKGIKEDFLLSYDKINRKNLVINSEFNHKKLGKILGYPECCINKFVEDYKENRATSICFDSAKRYLNQLKEMKIKEDPFRIKISKNGILIDSKIAGFIPCSPKCKKALKMIENYELINKILNQNAKI